MRLLFIILLISFMIRIVAAGTIDPDTDDSRYIDYGKNFSCIGMLSGKDSQDQYYCASAVAIKPKWILTAAHIVNRLKFCRIDINKKSIKINKILVHKDFKYENFGEYDIALCRCEEDIGLDEYPELYLNSDEVGKVCSISGYGFYGNFIKGAVEFDNNKRAGTNMIDILEKHTLVCSPSKEDKTELEFLIASGDSGGGLFIEDKLAGINSFVAAKDKLTDSSYGDESRHTRISMFTEWVEEVISNNKE